MRALHIDSEEPFASVFSGIAADWASLHWLTSFQCTPWDSAWLWEGPGESVPIEPNLLHIASIVDTSMVVWRQGTLPALIEKLVFFDEWSWLIGFDAESHWVEPIVGQLAEADWGSVPFLDQVDSLRGLVIVQPSEGHWVVYPSRTEWFDRLAARPDCHPVERNEWLRRYEP